MSVQAVIFPGVSETSRAHPHKSERERSAQTGAFAPKRCRTNPRHKCGTMRNCVEVCGTMWNYAELFSGLQRLRGPPAQIREREAPRRGFSPRNNAPQIQDTNVELCGTMWNYVGLCETMWNYVELLYFRGCRDFEGPPPQIRERKSAQKKVPGRRSPWGRGAGSGAPGRGPRRAG